MLPSYSSLSGSIIEAGAPAAENRWTSLSPPRIPPRRASLVAVTDSLRGSGLNAEAFRLLIGCSISPFIPAKAMSASALPKNHDPWMKSTPTDTTGDSHIRTPVFACPNSGCGLPRRLAIDICSMEDGGSLGEDTGRPRSQASTVFYDAPRCPSPKLVTPVSLAEALSQMPPTNTELVNVPRVFTIPPSPDQQGRLASSEYGSGCYPRSPISPVGSPAFPNGPEMIPELCRGVETLRKRFFSFFSSSSESLMAHWEDALPLELGEFSSAKEFDADPSKHHTPRGGQGSGAREGFGEGSSSGATIPPHDCGTVIRRSTRRYYGWQDGAERDASEDCCTLGSLTAVKSHVFTMSDTSGPETPRDMPFPMRNLLWNVAGKKDRECGRCCNYDGVHESSSPAAVTGNATLRGFEARGMISRWVRKVLGHLKKFNKRGVKKRSRRVVRWRWRTTIKEGRELKGGTSKRRFRPAKRYVNDRILGDAPKSSTSRSMASDVELKEVSM